MKLRAFNGNAAPTINDFATLLIGELNTHTWEENINIVRSWVYNNNTDMVKPDVKLGSSDHDTMLRQIAKMANLATEVFKRRNTDAGKNTIALAKLNSPYNDSIVSPTSAVTRQSEYNTAEYFGYKMTQWLLSEIEKCTVLVPKKDQNTPHAQLRAGIRDVNCQLYTAGLKSTYTTDVLLDITRKSFISPWEVMYGEDEGSWPEWLKAYSLKAHFCNVYWTGSDKRISVVVGVTHRVRYTFHAFKRRMEGVKVITKAPKKVESVSVANGVYCCTKKQLSVSNGLKQISHNEKRYSRDMKNMFKKSSNERHSLLRREVPKKVVWTGI
jgi:hypothetical protein